jgi:small subunit ribosomal protein S2
MSMERELEKLEFNLGGVADMERLPDAIVIVDLLTEDIGLREAARLEIPIVGLVDTNADPSNVSYIIPGNDDAIRSCDLIIRTLGEGIEGAASTWREAEAKRKAEEEEKRRKEEEERKKREAEEKAKQEAEAKAKAEAEAKAKAEADAKAQEAAKGQKPAAKKPPAEKPAAKKPPAEKPAAKPAPEPAATQGGGE